MDNSKCEMKLKLLGYRSNDHSTLVTCEGLFLLSDNMLGAVTQHSVFCNASSHSTSLPLDSNCARRQQTGR